MRIRAAICGIVIVAGATLAGCGTATAATCTPTGQWQQLPVNIRADKLANELGVDVSTVRAGMFGTATCDQPIQVSQIEQNEKPIVAVSGKGSRCVPIGVGEDPRKVRATKLLLVVCPRTGGDT